MENLASAYVWIGVTFFLVFLVFTYLSCWLYGLLWFVLTIAALASSLIAFAVEALTTTSGIQLWIIILILTWTFGVIFYLIAIRYITHTKLSDLTYQSHEAFGKFITEHGIVSPLATAVRALGPILLAGIVVLGCFGILAKTNGILT